MSLCKCCNFCGKSALAPVEDEGCTWIILFGTFLIQMTVPSVLSIYAVVLGYLTTVNQSDFNLWAEQIIFTPILFAAFWSLEDPWSKIVIDMAPVSRLVGVIGVILLAIGFLASGYLATGGVAAYLASLSAGAIMGIGASFVLVHADNVLWRYYKTKLSFALLVKNIASSVGYVFMPIVTFALLSAVGLRTGLLIAAIVFGPTLVGALLLRPPVSQRSLPYTLLLLNESRETSSPENLPNEMKSNADAGDSDNASGLAYFNDDGDDKAGKAVQPLFGEGQENYFYDEPHSEVNIFINPTLSAGNTWREEIQSLRSIKFWICAVTCGIVKVAGIYFWMPLPSILFSQLLQCQLRDGIILLVIAGFGTLVPAVLFHCQAKRTIRGRRLSFATLSCLGSVVFIGLTYSTDYNWFLTCALFGGISISGTSIYKHTVLSDFLGSQVMHRVSNALSTVTGITTLLLCFTYSITFALRLMATLQFIIGLYWMITSFF